MMHLTRRAFVDRMVKGSVLSLAFTVGGTQVLLTPEQARAQQVPLRQLDAAQLRILERLAETILPGSPQHGLAHYIDHQLGVDPDDALLIAKYFQVRPPYKDFYAAGLKTAAAKAQQLSGKPLADMNASEMKSAVREISRPDMVIEGYPLGLFYICLRSDAVDVTYGTPQGFARLNVPYLEHIMPPEGWNG
jgi:Gluconate 2-dehydrogenase subunit 3